MLLAPFVVGLTSITDILLKLSYKSPIYNLVEDFNDKDIEFKLEQNEYQVGSVEWVFAHMKRLALVDACKREIRMFNTTKGVDASHCSRCNILFHHDLKMSDQICANCGDARHVVMDEKLGWSTRSRYNRAPHHQYTPFEHFSQVVCDFTGTGDRNVPSDIMAYCRAQLGRGMHVTSHKVFRALQGNGYRAYYHCKYEIAARLRGGYEARMSNREIDKLKREYKRYSKEFMEFQRIHGIGKVSNRGRLRVYWPMRYILARMCEQIGRSDLTVLIRGIRGKKRLVEYTHYWNKLQQWVDHTCPPSTASPPTEWMSLKASRHSHK